MVASSCHRDNIFGAYQFSLDAKELAYSQLISVIKTKTAHGMVPNFFQPQQISYDRTEPPSGYTRDLPLLVG